MGMHISRLLLFFTVIPGATGWGALQQKCSLGSLCQPEEQLAEGWRELPTPVHCTRNTNSSAGNSRWGMERFKRCQKNRKTAKHVPQCLHSWGLANTACKRASYSASATTGLPQ